MPDTTEQRGGADRRSKPRGGRRPHDVDGYAPLVMVVGDSAAAGGLAETVLAKLKFAVSPASSVDDALRVLPTLRPDLVLARPDDAARLRLEAPHHLPVIVVSEGMREDPQLLVDEIRKTIRANAT